MARPAPPPVPEADLEQTGWSRSEDRTETVFEGLGVSARSRTLVYEDRELRTTVRDAGGPDRLWRFLFVAHLEIDPSPAFGAHAVLRPRIQREGIRAFGEELTDRGIGGVAAGETERFELAGDGRAGLTPFRGTLSVDTAETPPTEVEIAGRLALWYDDDFYVAGAAGPSGPIDGWTTVDTPGEELVDLIRTVA